MKRLVLILFLVSVCYGTPFYLLEVRGDTFTSHLKPITDSTLDIGTLALFWRYIYGDSFTDGTALWDSSALTGFASITSDIFTDGTAYWESNELYGFSEIDADSIVAHVDLYGLAITGVDITGTTVTGDTLTDGVFSVTGGTITNAIWAGTDIDISDSTNLVAGTNITLVDDTLNVDDAFLINDGDDTTTGTLTAGGFTTIGAVTAAGSTFGDGGTTDYTEFSVLGSMSMHGDARVTRHMNIGAPTWKRGATAPTETYENIFATLTFADAQDDEAHYTTWVPYRWDNTTDMTIDVRWQHDTVAKTGKVLWNLNYIGVKEGEDPAGAGTLISQLSAGNHAQDALIVTVFGTKMLAANLERHDDLGLKLWRDGDDGTDDLTEGAELVAVHIHYTMNRLGDPFETFFLLLETGDFLLLETGDKLILEGI